MQPPCRKKPRRHSLVEEKQVSGLVSLYLLPSCSRCVDVWQGWLRRACLYQGARHHKVRVEHRAEIQSNEFQHLSEGTKVARLQRPFFLFTTGIFIAHASSSLQTGRATCVYLTAPFATPGVCTSVSYRGGNRVQGMERSERGWGAGSESGAGTEA